MQKLFSYSLACLTAIAVIGCSTQKTVIQPTLNSNQGTTNIFSANKIEAPITKKLVTLKEAKFTESDFSKIAENEKDIPKEIDEAFTKVVMKNSPYSIYNGGGFEIFAKDVQADNYNDFKFMSQNNAKTHFEKNQNAFQTVQNLYGVSDIDMKRFIKVDTLANCLQVDGYILPYKEVHNPPFVPKFKIKPPAAAYVMPTFSEIYNYNQYGQSAPYLKWNMQRATQYYRDNYPRYMALIMEFAPSKQRAYDLIHKEISQYAEGWQK